MSRVRESVKRESNDYPKSLREIVPEVESLYYRGKWDNAIFRKCVAVVGARKISRYGKQVIEELAPRLVAAGYTVISGFMYGVDIEMHSKVILNGGRTIAVLGHGIDYPIDPQYDDLYHKIIDKYGLVLSEWKNVVPRPFTYLERNRIVVGLSEMVIVVEAGSKSGSLHSAKWAVKLGKKLWAVPGPIFSDVSRGTNELIASSDAEILTWERLDKYLNRNRKENYSKKVRNNQANCVLTESEKTIVTLLTLEGPMSVNQISRKLHTKAGDITGELAQLLIADKVREERGVWLVN